MREEGGTPPNVTPIEPTQLYSIVVHTHDAPRKYHYQIVHYDC